MKKLLFIVLVVVACNEKPAVPKGILPPQKMQAIMLDLIHVDGRIANAVPADSLIRLPAARYKMYQQVLALHGTNKDVFKKSLHHYEQHPPMLKETINLMDKTLDQQLKDTATTKKKEQPKAL